MTPGDIPPRHPMSQRNHLSRWEREQAEEQRREAEYEAKVLAELAEQDREWQRLFDDVVEEFEAASFPHRPLDDRPEITDESWYGIEEHGSGYPGAPRGNYP